MRSPVLSALFAVSLALATTSAPDPARAHGDEHVCGDGVVEAEEQCDDANQIDDDTCHNDCTLNCSAEDYPSTFAAIQDKIFEGYGCADLACHSSFGAPVSGGLNLEAASSYVGLLGAGTGAASSVSLLKRVEPSEPELSFLYLKLLKKTDPAEYAEIHPIDDVGTPMPNTNLTVTTSHLDALKLWIRGGAPEDKVVEGTSELLGTCLPPPDPLKIPVPDPPPVDGEGDHTGFQLQQTPWPLPPNTLDEQGEDEICMATYYDLTAGGLVPDWASVACPEGLRFRKGCSHDPAQECASDPECGTGNTCIPVKNAANPTSECLYWHGQTLYQDPQSHHSIVHIYTGGSDTSDPGWGVWTYKLEPTDPDPEMKNGQPCNPTDVDPAVGYNPGCSGTVVSTIACNDYGPDDANQFSVAGGGGNLPQFSGSQEPFYQIEFADGVFALLPKRGIIVWNGHAFNRTQTPSTMAQYLNLDFARPEDQVHPARAIFDARWIFAQYVAPFDTAEICSTTTLPQYSRLFQLSSHTHQRGVMWRTWAPPNTPCRSACLGHLATTFFGCNDDPSLPLCEGPREDDDPLYLSTDYSDPLQLDLDPEDPAMVQLLDSPNEEDRTFLFCSLYDNGSTPDSPPVKQRSTSPVPPPIAGVPPSVVEPILGGPCPDETVACLGPLNQGALCGHDHSICGDPALCDACPVHGGVTTEDEMFINLGSYYVAPEPASRLLGVLALGTVALLARRARKA